MVYAILIHALDTPKGTQASIQQQQQQIGNEPVVFLSQFYTSEGNNQDFLKRQQSIVKRVIKDYTFKHQCENTKPDEKLFPDWAFAFAQRGADQSNSSKEGIFRISPLKKQPLACSSSSAAAASPLQSPPPQQQPSQQWPSDHLSSISTSITHSSRKTQVVPIDDPSQFISSPKYVIWRKICGVGFTVVCEEDENRLLLSNFLTMLAQLILDHFKLTSKNLTTEVFTRTDDILLILHNYLPNGQTLFISNSFSRQLKQNIQSQQQ
ncbi:hypothetical protein CYY_001126 [Polysphondylium violaceum]|uniref:Uncharacterized protein n=1 Tax=Polysphondylium violaceum TaxID=133409 RepID=A0A8J4Q1L5_9MYCE|nr:hypothetical protein CYY_001126 [Polysphondylium violaceum]